VPPPSTTNSAVPTCRLLPHLRAELQWRDARLPQADHDRRWLGNIPRSMFKIEFRPGTRLIQLGGPGMLIGLGGGAASSMATGTNTADLDFASVQRGNPEIQRRCQEVIDRCWQLGDDNPILHPRRRRRRHVQRLPELARTAGCGAAFRRCAPCRAPSRACRRARSGATRRRSATCWRLRRRAAGPFDAPCASASAARLRWSAPRPAMALTVKDETSATARRHAAGGAVRQAAAHAPQRPAQIDAADWM
jgi:hypothetical protein